MHVPAGSIPPAGTFVHVPRLLESAQVWQAPLQALLQQKPCAQSLETHSVPSAHGWPLPLRPHEPVAVLQSAGGMQSTLLAQVVLHAVVAHLNGKQAVGAGVTQAPAPSQLDAGVEAIVAVAQTAPLQVVPLPYCWQKPAWHLPFVPQLAAPWSLQRPAGSLAPVGTVVHLPIVPVSPHDWQAPPHALSQQKPCAQNPDWHSLASEHEAPVGLGPHELPVQTFGATQFLLAVQAVKQAAPLHVYGLQAIVAGATHWPVALQVDAGL